MDQHQGKRGEKNPICEICENNPRVGSPPFYSAGVWAKGGSLGGGDLPSVDEEQ